MSQKRPIKVLIGKPGLDGHDVGAKVVGKALREAGMEVIYSGLHRTVDEIFQTAIQEKVDVIGLSVLSGAHLPIVQKLMEKLKEKGTDIPVVIGGVIPEKDIPVMKSYGVAEVCKFGTPLNEIVETISKMAGRGKAS